MAMGNKDYILLGVTDAVADNTAALQKAIDAASRSQPPTGPVG